jgi:hypothetical protein
MCAGYGMAIAQAKGSPGATAIRRATDWVPKSPAVSVPDPVSPRSDDAVRWFEIEGEPADAGDIAALLAPVCPELDVDMVREVLTADDLPVQNPHPGGQVRLASACHAEAIPYDRDRRRGRVEEVGGELVIHPVEVLAGEGWLITCWHPVRIPRGRETAKVELVQTPNDLHDCVNRRWKGGEGSSSGDLGTLLLCELMLSCVSVARELESWLENWELSYFLNRRTDSEELESYKKELTELWTSMAFLRDWVKPQNKSGLKDDLDKSLLRVSESELALKADDWVDECLSNLRDLAANLRSSFNLIHVQEFEEQRDRREQLIRTIEIVAAVFLVPTLIVGFYGANTWVPGQGRHWGFWIMVLILVASAAISVAGVLLWRSREDREG